MNKKLEANHENLQPEIAPPVERHATGTMFQAQPSGGVEPSILLLPLPFAGDDAE